MRYIGLMLLSCALAAAAYFATVFSMVPAPIEAEYWVREMLVVKRGIARAHASERKLVVAAGSAALFGIDTAQLGRELGARALNFGLHAAMSLDRILSEAGQAASDGDAIVLALEPALYCGRGPSAWQARNAIAWDREQWLAWSLLERVRAIATLGPGVAFEMAAARRELADPPRVLLRRLAALDDASVLTKWASAPEPKAFNYSAYHLDRLGNMRGIEGSQLEGAARSPDDVTAVCAGSVRVLRAFVARMQQRNILVRFANSPYLADHRVPMKDVEAASGMFLKEVSGIAPLVDRRTDVLFPREYFFNTFLHLNSRGREMRTRRLATAIHEDAGLCRQLQVRC